MRLASELAAHLAQDGGWLLRQEDREAIVDILEIDGEIQALDVSINLRNNSEYKLALKLLTRIRDRYPDSVLAMYQTALSAAGMLDHDTAIRFCVDALARAPFHVEFRSTLIRVCALAGRYGDARDAIRSAVVNTRPECWQATVLAQFVDHCEAYPLTKVKAALRRLHQAGTFARPTGVQAAILSAVKDGRPFSLVRLGDGEGAWLSLDPYDDGRHDALYRHNRVSFLEDWFGSNDLIDQDDFFQFSLDLQKSFRSHDIVGIPGMARLEQEESFISIRGITASVNTFRYLGLMDDHFRRQLYCSNSINLALAAHTDFYRQLFSMARKIGIVTSHPILIDKLTAADLDVVSSHIVPGDSRNFHRGAGGSPACQFPSHLQRVDADLARRDCRGTVFLIAAGFIGKRYIQTVRDRGGIALDIGALADYWAREGLPI